MSPTSKDTVQQPINVQVAGPGPYGFRLLGGEGQPLVVAKLRPSGKSHDAGLREDDVILAINGRSCKSINHAEAMRLLEAASIHLNLQVIRGAAGKDAIDAAFSNLAPTAQDPTPPAPPHAQLDPEPQAPLPQQNGPLSLPAVIISEQAESKQQEISGRQNVETEGHLQRSMDTTARTTIETKMTVEHQGGVTVTKTTKQVVRDQSSVEPPFTYYISERERAKQEFLRRCREQRQDLSPHRPTSTPYYQPEAAIYSQPEVTWYSQVTEQPTRNEDTIAHHHIPSTSPVYAPYITSTLPAPYVASSEGSISPYFRTYQQTPEIFSRSVGEYDLLPSFVPPEYPRCQPSLVKFHVRHMEAKPWVWQPKQGREVQNRAVAAEFDFGLQRDAEEEEEYYEEEVPQYSYSHLRNVDGARRHLRNVSPEIKELDPSYFQKNKVFIDPSFCDDPEYATIKERIKMARRIAQSLTAPVNVAARGQRLFIHKQAESDFHRDSAEYDPHYNPAPWEPASRNPSPSWQKKLEIPAVFKKEKGSFRSKVRFPRKFEKRSSSADLERRTANAIQSGELFANRGRGSQLFAMRRAKFEEPEEYAPSFHLPKFSGSRFNLDKITHQLSYDFPIFDREPTRHCRLHELIDEYNSRRSPWDGRNDYSSAVGLFYENLYSPEGRGRDWELEHSYNPDASEQHFSVQLSGRTRDYIRPVRFKAPHSFGSMTSFAGLHYGDAQTSDDDVPFTDF